MSHTLPPMGANAQRVSQQHGGASRNVRRDDVLFSSPLHHTSREHRTSYESHAQSSVTASQPGSSSMSSGGTPTRVRQHCGGATREETQRGQSGHTARLSHSRSSAEAQASSTTQVMHALPHLAHLGPASSGHTIEPATRPSAESSAGTAPRLSLPSLPCATLHNNNNNNTTTTTVSHGTAMTITPRRRSNRGREAAIATNGSRPVHRTLQPSVTSTASTHHGSRVVDSSEASTQHSFVRRQPAVQSPVFTMSPASPYERDVGACRVPACASRGEAPRSGNPTRPTQLSPCVALPYTSSTRTRMTSATTRSPLPRTGERPSRPIGTVLRRPDPPPPPPAAALSVHDKPSTSAVITHGALSRTHEHATDTSKGTSWSPRWFLAAGDDGADGVNCQPTTPEERDYAVQQGLDALFDAMTHDLAAAEPANVRRWMLHWFTDLQQRQSEKHTATGTSYSTSSHSTQRPQGTWHMDEDDKPAEPQATKDAPRVSEKDAESARLSFTVSSLGTGASGASSVRRAEHDGTASSLRTQRPPSASARHDSVETPETPLPFTHHRPLPPQQAPQSQQQQQQVQPRSTAIGGTAKESLTSAARGHMSTSASDARQPLHHGVPVTLGGVFAAPSHA